MHGPRDQDIGVTVVVVQYPPEGYIDVVRDTNDPYTCMKLHAGNKIVITDKRKLNRKLKA
ncbi:hypothetical protein EDC04DRAFT_2668091 [Pisolithus marmoratus]|nr:hypothetical protein EDC04DRAFT_2668091 [Pisolithus marmoratus]